MGDTWRSPSKQEAEKIQIWAKLSQGYACFLSRCPYVMIIMTFVLLLATSWSSFHFYPPPDFSEDPSKGFSARGSYISKSISTLARLYSSIGRTYALFPDETHVLEQVGIGLDDLLEIIFNHTATRTDDAGSLVDRWSASPGRGMDSGDSAFVSRTGSYMLGNGNGSSVDSLSEAMDSMDWNQESMNISTDHLIGTANDANSVLLGMHDTVGKAKDYMYINGANADGGYMDYKYKGTLWGRKQSVEPDEPVLSDVLVKEEASKKPACQCTYYFCLKKKPIFVFETVRPGGDLFTVDAMHSICRFQDTVIYPRTPQVGTVTCEALSMTNLIARRFNKTCHAITQDDLDKTKKLIVTCAKDHIKTYDIPAFCSEDDRKYVTIILQTFAQIGFYNNNTDKVGVLQYTAVYTIGTYRSEPEFFRQNFLRRSVQDNHVKISAVRFANHYRTKWDVLGELVISDLLYFGVALGLVFLVMSLYLRSGILMLSLLLNVCTSLTSAYFVYHFILHIPFFPYLNLLAVLVLIAIGADDMFIFYDSWEQAKSGGVPLENTMVEALHHAVLSVVVTSLTTASAFLATTVSHIIAIKVFSIFSGICVLMNLFYMLTLTPAIIVSIDKVQQLCLKSPLCKKLSAGTEGCTKKFHEVSVLIFHRTLPVLVDRSWFVWIFLLLAQGIGACVVIFVYPKFELPDNQEFQLFPDRNVIQNWDSKMRTKFQAVINQDEGRGHEYIRMNFVFGIQADDPGNHLDPDDTGENVPLMLDTAFDMADPQTQLFIYDMCHDLVKQPFMPDYPWHFCHLDYILHTLKLYCRKARMQLTGCCPDPISIPIESEMFRRCVGLYQILLTQSKSLNNHSRDIVRYLNQGHFLFRTYDQKVVGYMYYVSTGWKASFSFYQMATYNKAIMGFLDEQLAHGPAGVQRGFVAYHDWFWFYDLQLALTSGTFSSILLSVCVAFLVMLVTSRNALITLYAMTTISLAIMCTVAVLVFLGWQLNIVESMILSLAVGLSIDFTIHYGMAYRLSEAGTSGERVAEGFCTVGNAVTMATLTTFVAGAAVMGCEVLIYLKLGIFLMVVMSFSWIYATFFFQSLCHIIGPSKQCYAACGSSFCRHRNKHSQHRLVS